MDDIIRILHVDDEPDFAEMVATFVEREDERSEIETVTSAGEGLDRLASDDFDCVVSDYDMPEQDGIEFLEAVRERYTDLPFILYTGKGSEEVASDAISAGVTEYMQKETGTGQYPVLANRIKKAVDRREAERERARQLEAIERAQEGISILDDDHHYIYVNQRFADLHGYDPSEMIGEHWELAYPDEDISEVKQEILPAVEQEGYWHGETTSVRSDGSTVVVDHTLATTERGELVCTVRDVSDRKQREQKLRRKTSRLEALFENSPDMINLHDADGNILSPNSRLCESTGYDASELTGMKVWELDQSIDHSEAHALWNQIDVGERRRLEGAYQRRDGSCFPVEVHISSFRLEGEDRFVAFARDITKRKQREHQLRQYKDLLESINDAVFVVDQNQRVVYANEQSLANVGLTAQEIDSEPIMPLVEQYSDTQSGVVEFKQALRTALDDCEDENPGPVELTVTAGESESVYEHRFSPMSTRPKFGDEDVSKAVAIVARNVTAQKERINAIKQIETLFKNAQDILFIIEHLGDEFVIKRVNHAFESVTGLSNDDIRGKTPQELFGEAHGQDIVHKYRQCLETGQPLSYEETLAEEQVPNKESPVDDGLVYWRTHITPVEMDGEVDWIVGATRDINQEKRREQELKRRNERLDEFSSIISHDLRNPLNVIDGKLELARGDCESDHLADAAEAVNRCQALIDDLYTLAREGSHIEETNTVALADIAEQSWQTTTTESADLNIRTQQRIQADSSRLQQLFENLYRNAVEHGGEDLTITVGDLSDEDGFYVADDGRGIPKTERTAVFEAGYSTREKGTGFGLRIVNQIANAHMWEVALTESKDGGARFEITGVEHITS
jgi:PAS domain S-box-containing protein